MRIIGGKHRGRVLKTFEGEAVRPTSDRAREALFNVLQNEIFDSVFYDGFAGSGAVGLEALSRGAKKVVLTDVSSESVKLTKANAALLKETPTILNVDCVSFLGSTDEKFDIIFLDPPYKKDDGELALKIIAERDILSKEGVAVLEKDREGVDMSGLDKQKIKKYGKAFFTFYKKKNV